MRICCVISHFSRRIPDEFITMRQERATAQTVNPLASQSGGPGSVPGEST